LRETAVSVTFIFYQKVKVVKEDSRNQRQKTRLAREIAALRVLKHLYIVSLLWTKRDALLPAGLPEDADGEKGSADRR